MGEFAACKGGELHVTFKKVAVRKYGKVEHAHNALKAFRMNICEGASHKITADKPLVGKVYSGEGHSSYV